MKDRRGKIALFIHGSNLRGTAKALGFDIDYKRLLTEFGSHGTVLRAFYYVLTDDQGHLDARPVIDWLDYNGFTVVTKSTKEFVDAEGWRKLKGNVDVEIAVHAIEISKHVDEVVLFSGDANFRSLVEALQRHGTRVCVVSSTATEPASVANELRRQADVFIDLAELRPRICRDLSAGRDRKMRQAAPPLLAEARRNGEGSGKLS